jgi:hypothetical protein
MRGGIEPGGGEPYGARCAGCFEPRTCIRSRHHSERANATGIRGDVQQSFLEGMPVGDGSAFCLGVVPPVTDVTQGGGNAFGSSRAAAALDNPRDPCEHSRARSCAGNSEVCGVLTGGEEHLQHAVWWVTALRWVEARIWPGCAGCICHGSGGSELNDLFSQAMTRAHVKPLSYLQRPVTRGAGGDCCSL